MARAIQAKQAKWNRDRVFAGKRYHYFGGLLVNTKAEAQRLVKGYKDEGKSARVVQVKTEAGRIKYGVWIR